MGSGWRSNPCAHSHRIAPKGTMLLRLPQAGRTFIEPNATCLLLWDLCKLREPPQGSMEGAMGGMAAGLPPRRHGPLSSTAVGTWEEAGPSPQSRQRRSGQSDTYCRPKAATPRGLPEASSSVGSHSPMATLTAPLPHKALLENLSYVSILRSEG